MTALVEAIRPPRARPAWLVDALAVVTGSLVVAALAQVSVRLPFTPVPISGQTLGVMLVGGALGARLGGAALLLYLAEGAIGLPFYAEGKSGLEILALSSATGGYLWGFLIAAVVIGWLAQKRWDREAKSAISAMVIGEIIIFTIGVLWLAQALDVPVAGDVGGRNALTLGFYPFIVGDVIKLLLAAALLPTAWRFVPMERDRR